MARKKDSDNEDKDEEKNEKQKESRKKKSGELRESPDESDEKLESQKSEISDEQTQDAKPPAQSPSPDQPLQATPEEQPPPPSLSSGSQGTTSTSQTSKDSDKHTGGHDHKHHHGHCHDHDQHGHDEHCHDHDHHHWHHFEEALEAVYSELLEVRKINDRLLKEAIEKKLEKRYESAPVQMSDLMSGCQAALARANRASVTGDYESEDIAGMMVKDFEIEVNAPMIESGHAQDPVLMLPNIKSVDSKTSNVKIKFAIQSTPKKSKE